MLCKTQIKAVLRYERYLVSSSTTSAYTCRCITSTSTRTVPRTRFYKCVKKNGEDKNSYLGGSYIFHVSFKHQANNVRNFKRHDLPLGMDPKLYFLSYANTRRAFVLEPSMFCWRNRQFMYQIYNSK